MYLSNPTPTLLPQTLAWGSFKANDNQMPTLIFSNTLRLNFTGLTQNTAYNWTIKVQKGLPNASALDSNNFTTGAGETTKSLNIYLMAGLYNVGNTYFFGLAQAVAGGEEGIQFDFKIDNRITLDTGGSTITGQLLNQAFSYSGQSFDVLTNRFLDELSLEKTNITAFTNAKIPTTLALQTYVTSAISGKENTANKGVANGYASLDSDGKVPNSQIPLLAIKNVFPVSSQAQMLALTAQVGDMAIRSDLNKAFILKEEPASTLANWLEILTPVDQVLSVNGQTGAVSLSTANISENTNLYFTEARVRSTPLTGFTATNTPITATDSVLVALGEAQGQINSINTNIINIQPQVITTTILNYKTRFAAATNYQMFALGDLLKNIYLITGGILPDFLAHPNFSFDLSNPASTTFYNCGSLNGGDGSLVNGNVGNMTNSTDLLFARASSQYINTTFPSSITFTVYGKYTITGGSVPATNTYNIVSSSAVNNAGINIPDDNRTKAGRTAGTVLVASASGVNQSSTANQGWAWSSKVNGSNYDYKLYAKTLSLGFGLSDSVTSATALLAGGNVQIGARLSGDAQGTFNGSMKTVMIFNNTELTLGQLNSLNALIV
jgi:hypothetical protein